MLDQPYFAEFEDLAQTIRDLLSTTLPPLSERDTADSRANSAAALWKHLEQVGVPGIGVSEELGGVGGGLPELAVVARELGRALAPESIVAAGLAGELLGSSKPDTPQAKVLRELAAGAQGAVALPVPGAVHIDGSVISAELRGVVDLDKAQWLLILTLDELVVVDVRDPGLRIRQIDHSAMLYSTASVTLDRVVASVFFVDAADRARAVSTARVLLTYEMLGAAEAALLSAAEYVSAREQFGRPIGTFQAVSHRLAAAYIELQATSASAAYAVRAQRDSRYEISAIVARDEAVRSLIGACEAAMQVFGAIAFTWEHHLHHYLKYAKSCERLLATANTAEALIVRYTESGR